MFQKYVFILCLNITRLYQKDTSTYNFTKIQKVIAEFTKISHTKKYSKIWPELGAQNDDFQK